MDVFIDPRFDADYARHPIRLADAGARGGLRPNWRSARRHLQLIGFEPDTQEFDRLSARTAGGPDRFFPVALHHRAGPIVLNVARDRGLSSIFEPDRAVLDAFPDPGRFDIVERRELPADTLDDVLATHGIDGLDFIKADTQGSELFVLQGAQGVLASSVVGVEVEVEFLAVYRDQPLFADIDTLLREQGFALFDLRPCYWKRAAAPAAGGPYGQIVWADALYLKRRAALDANMAGLEPERQRSTALKAVSVALLYGYADYALELSRASDHLWSTPERTTLDACLGNWPARHHPLPAFPGHRRLASLLGRLAKRVHSRYDGWSVSDPDLGNLD